MYSLVFVNVMLVTGVCSALVWVCEQAYCWFLKGDLELDKVLQGILKGCLQKEDHLFVSA